MRCGVGERGRGVRDEIWGERGRERGGVGRLQACISERRCVGDAWVVRSEHGGT